jgi:hypothetical protein
VKIAARKRAAEILRQIIELEERAERRWSVFTKRHAVLMREFDRHARIEEALLPTASEIEAALAAMDTASRLIDRLESARARINGQVAKLLEELRPLWGFIEARERARLVANFGFWMEKKTKGRN